MWISMKFKTISLVWPSHHNDDTWEQIYAYGLLFQQIMNMIIFYNMLKWEIVVAKFNIRTLVLPPPLEKDSMPWNPSHFLLDENFCTLIISSKAFQPTLNLLRVALEILRSNSNLTIFFLKVIFKPKTHAYLCQGLIFFRKVF